MLDEVMNTFPTRVPAVLGLNDGSFFAGYSVGYEGDLSPGEVVFNTAMTGYQEILTDPSYSKQIVTLTYPHIGNVGINPVDHESDAACVAGLVIGELSPVASNYRSELTLAEFLTQQKVVAIAGIDTRALTRRLRDHGAMAGCICIGTTDPTEAIAGAKACPSLSGQDLTAFASVAVPTAFTETSWQQQERGEELPAADKHVVVYDFGIKKQIARLLVDRGCRVTLVPANTPYADLAALKPDAVLLSNGPGDPAACDAIIAEIKQLVEGPWPVFGICLGCQLLALAMGATTDKMSLGHHGANHPVLDQTTGRVHITSQNHGFVVSTDGFPDNLKITDTSLFDATVQGFVHRDKPIFAIQGHPEASPGPEDWVGFFDRFIDAIDTSKQGAKQHA